MTDLTVPSEPVKRPLVVPFFSEAFAQTKDIPEQTSSIHGRFFNHFLEICDNSDQQLKEIRSDLPDGLLKPVTDMGVENYSFYSNLPSGVKEQVDRVRNTRKTALGQLVQNEIKPILQVQTLAPTALSIPTHYHKQEHNRTCATANFRMIFESLTGEAVEEQTLLTTARSQNMTEEGQISGEMISEKALFDIFQTQSFKERFPSLDVRTVNFFGGDFEDLVNFSGKVREQVPGAEIYCRVSLVSEVVNDGWHDVILISADETTVTIHDPSSSVGTAYRTIPKDQFIERWGKTFLSSHLTIVF